MPTDSTKPTWIEPPPPKRGGMGCFAKGCLVLVVLGVLTFLLFGVASYLLYSRGSKPTTLPVEELPPAELASVQQRVDQFEAMPPAPAPSPTPVAPAAPDETPTPVPVTPAAGASARPDRGRDQRLDFRQQEITRTCLCLAERKHRACADQHSFRQSAGISARLFEWEFHDHDERADSHQRSAGFENPGERTSGALGRPLDELPGPIHFQLRHGGGRALQCQHRGDPRRRCHFALVIPSAVEGFRGLKLTRLAAARTCSIRK